MSSKHKDKMNEIIIVFLSIIMGVFATYLTISRNQNIGLLFFKIIVIFFLSICVHEMGHLMAFLIKGYSISFLIIGPLLFKVEDNIRIKLKLKLTPAIIGGAVYPVGKCIDDDVKFKDAVTDMKFILLAGPLFSLVICLIALIILYNKGLSISSFLLFLTNLMVIYMSFIEYFHVQGDIKVLLRLMKERESITPHIFNYTVFSGNSNRYILNKMINYIEKNIIKDRQDIIVATHLNTLIDWLLIEKISIPKKIEEYIMFYMKNPGKFNKANYIFKKNICILIHKLIYSEVILKNNLDLAEEYFRILTEKMSIPISSDLEYHIKRTEYILNIKDNSYFFNDRKNIKPDAAYSMYNELSWYLMKEKILNDRILTK